MIMFNTTKYIDVLPQIISNYNSSYHSGIKKAPNDVVDDDDLYKLQIENITKLKTKKQNI